jgi:hypothetical protein
MPYITRSNDDKARQDKEFETIAEANKQEWLAKARRGAAEDDARNEMMAEAQDEVAAAFPNDSKGHAEAMLRRRAAIDAQLAKWRETGEWPLTRAEHAVRDAGIKKADDEVRAKMDAEAKANAAKAAKPVPDATTTTAKPFWPKAKTIEADRKAAADAEAKLAADEKDE